MRIIHYIDIETTHLDHTQGEIIEIAILTSTDGGKRISDRFQTKIKPLRLDRAAPKALEVNGYSKERWEGSPQWSHVAPIIAAKLRHGVIVSHNIAFDWVWVNHHVHQTTGKGISWLKMCTQALVLEHLPLERPSMRKVRDFFGWSHDGAHSAYKDAWDCCLIWRKLHRATILHRLWWELRYRLT